MAKKKAGKKAAKKTAVKKTAVKKTAVKKTAGKKTAAKKTFKPLPTPKGTKSVPASPPDEIKGKLKGTEPIKVPRELKRHHKKEKDKIPPPPTYSPPGVPHQFGGKGPTAEQLEKQDEKKLYRQLWLIPEAEHAIEQAVGHLNDVEIQKETLKTTLVKLKERLSEVEEDDWQVKNEPEESRGEEAELTQAAIDEIEGSIEDGLGDDFPTLICHFTILRETHLDRLKVAQIREHYATKPEWIARMDKAQLNDKK
jgi:hypothetical protein